MRGWRLKRLRDEGGASSASNSGRSGQVRSEVVLALQRYACCDQNHISPGRATGAGRGGSKGQDPSLLRSCCCCILQLLHCCPAQQHYRAGESAPANQGLSRRDAPAVWNRGPTELLLPAVNVPSQGPGPDVDCLFRQSRCFQCSESLLESLAWSFSRGLACLFAAGCAPGGRGKRACLEEL